VAACGLYGDRCDGHTGVDVVVRRPDVVTGATGVRDGVFCRVKLWLGGYNIVGDLCWSPASYTLINI
jgi:hypothetical protein